MALQISLDLLHVCQLPLQVQHLSLQVQNLHTPTGLSCPYGHPHVSSTSKEKEYQAPPAFQVMCLPTHTLAAIGWQQNSCVQVNMWCSLSLPSFQAAEDVAQTDLIIQLGRAPHGVRQAL